jgi:hypothetical protein
MITKFNDNEFIVPASLILQAWRKVVQYDTHRHSVETKCYHKSTLSSTHGTISIGGDGSGESEHITLL